MRHRRAPLAALLAAVIAAGVLPAMPVAADDEPVYHLPARMGASLEVKQGTGGDLGRVAGQEHAFDFVAADGPERFDVVAARGGTVIGARSGVVGGRCDEPLDGPRPACWRDVNYVLIDHGDGTSALYTHLKRDTLQVSSGQVVSAGQPLGTSGHSGWTDEVSLGFQVQETPTWDARGRGGWFQTASLPISFSDADVIGQRPDGVPETGDTITSANSFPLRGPFRFRTRPSALPAAVPLADGVERELVAAYDADSPDGYGLHFAAPSGVTTEVQPLFGGEVVFAGCATGASAPLGQTVAVRFDLEDTSFLAVQGHLATIEPSLLEVGAPEAPRVVGPNDTIGTYGASDLDDSDSETEVSCPDATADDELFVAILRDGDITPEGELVDGTPVSPEPLVGERGYEGLAWWSGPLVGTEVAARSGRPSARWNDKTPATGTHMTYGQPITLKARVRDDVEIAQVRFRAWYPRWPQVEPSRALASFDPDASWREIAVCDAPGRETGSGNLCQWQGDGQDARVTYIWDPTVAKRQPSAPWLPRARPAISESSAACVPVWLTVEVIDTAGHVSSGMRPISPPLRCDDPGVDDLDRDLRALYLDPLVPPRAPASRGTEDRGWPPVYGPDPLKGAIVWRDRSNNEDGFRIYARRHWFKADCSVAKGSWRLVATTTPNKQRYRPKHGQVVDSLPVPDTGAPGTLDYWEYSVSAFNTAGETSKVPVGGFLGGSEAFCDPGVGPPPELEG